MLDCGRLTGQIGLRCTMARPTYSTTTPWKGNMWVICFLMLVLPVLGDEKIVSKFDPPKCSYKSLPYQCFAYGCPSVGGAPIRPAAFPNSGNGAAGDPKKTTDTIWELFPKQRRGSVFIVHSMTGWGKIKKDWNWNVLQLLARVQGRWRNYVLNQ